MGKVDWLGLTRVQAVVIGQYHIHVMKYEAIEAFFAGHHKSDVHQFVFVELAFTELKTIRLDEFVKTLTFSITTYVL